MCDFVPQKWAVKADTFSYSAGSSEPLCVQVNLKAYIACNDVYIIHCVVYSPDKIIS